MACPWRVMRGTLLVVAILSTRHLYSLGGDVHEVLAENGLPMGLLPQNAASFTISDDGDFVVLLDRPCQARFDRTVYYDDKIIGRVSYGSVTDLSGIEVVTLFFKVPVTRIQADSQSASLEFYGGPFYEKLPAHIFQDIPTCV